jgi:hypothetical protein
LITTNDYIKVLRAVGTGLTATISILVLGIGFKYAIRACPGMKLLVFQYRWLACLQRLVIDQETRRRTNVPPSGRVIRAPTMVKVDVTESSDGTASEFSYDMS